MYKIIKYINNDNAIYEITDIGKNTINLTIDTIPGIQKLNIDSNFKENLDSTKDKFAVSAEYTPLSDTNFSVRCKIIENNDSIFDLQALAGSPEQAKQIVDNWKNNCINIYPKILELLVTDNGDTTDE